MDGVPSSYLEDASGYAGTASALFIPSSPEEAAEILRRASETLTPVTISGAGTGVTGGRCPAGGWILSTGRLRRLEVAPGRAVVGAGVTLEQLHAEAARSGQFFPPDPTETSASLGGVIATNASGARSFRYGPARRWLRSLVCATIGGSLFTCRRGEPAGFPYTPLPAPPTTKHTAGYHLPENLELIDLVCGSEGTLAVVLEAEVILLPQPAALLAGVVFFPSEELALAAVAPWREIPLLRMLEFFDPGALSMLRLPYPEIPAAARAALLVEQEIAGPDSSAVDQWLARLERAGALEDSWFGDTPADRERFRRFRHALPELVNDRVRRNGHQKLGSDFAVPVHRNLEMMRWYRQRLDRDFPARAAVFGHVGDAHLHVNILPESEDDAARGRAFMIGAARHAVSLGGTVSAEHGLGKRKAHLLPIQYTVEQIGAMRAVKRHFDPQSLLGRGNLFADP
jgi:FAD/FMN-containing dehydrogenase